MEEIRNHLETKVEDATREYDDTYYMWKKVETEFKRLQEEFHSLGQAVIKAETNMNYYKKLLNELNEHENKNDMN
jgi:predicted RNase H-like nuclease (RuvC/YqgF family)